MISSMEGKPPKLSTIFNEAWGIHEKLENSELASGSGEYQSKLTECIQLLERATMMVNDLSLFSQNEKAEEIPTSDIRYLLLPALLSDLTMRITTDERLEVLDRAKVYWKDFIARCRCYELTDEEIPEEPSGDRVEPTVPPNLRAMEAKREAKIKRYKEKKDLEKKLQTIGTWKYVTTKDDETQREYYLLMLRTWIHKAHEELPGIYQEMEMLQHMAKRRERGEDHASPSETAEPKRKPLKPFVLLRDKLQAEVFGAGYPSLPTMTLEEYYQKEIAEGKILLNSSNPGQQEEEAEKLASEVRKEQDVETDDTAALEKARGWDDWKDDHRKGWGNRENMG